MNAKQAATSIKVKVYLRFVIKVSPYLNTIIDRKEISKGPLSFRGAICKRANILFFKFGFSANGLSQDASNRSIRDFSVLRYNRR